MGYCGFFHALQNQGFDEDFFFLSEIGASDEMKEIDWKEKISCREMFESNL